MWQLHTKVNARKEEQVLSLGDSSVVLLARLPPLWFPLGFSFSRHWRCHVMTTL